MRFELYLIHRATNSGPKPVDRASASTHESHALVLVACSCPPIRTAIVTTAVHRPQATSGAPRSRAKVRVSSYHVSNYRSGCRVQPHGPAAHERAQSPEAGKSRLE
jgi:hypothetical protein